MKLKYISSMLFAFMPFIIIIYVGTRSDIDSNYLPFWAKNSEFLINYWYMFIALVICLITFGFIWHCAQNKTLTRTEKYGWAVALFLFNPLLNPVYWWQNIKKPPNKSLQSDARKARAPLS
jgi:hypothetical protein